MRMQKRQFRIGELAKHLNVKKFVIRFWEKEFALPATRSNGGQRFYNEDDINNFCIIKSLLYEQGFTIAGARKYLQETSISGESPKLSASKDPIDLGALSNMARRTTTESSNPMEKTISTDILPKLAELKQHLLLLRELL